MCSYVYLCVCIVKCSYVYVCVYLCFYANAMLMKASNSSNVKRCVGMR